MPVFEKDQYWMKRALVLARKAAGCTTPNPLVGAIVVNSEGKLVGSGFHAKAGQAHAEAMALQQAQKQAQHGTLYVTLEPCCHTGKTPPCVQTIIQHQIRRVVVAQQDPNPRVQGKGIAALKASGIEVELGCLQEKAKILNQDFYCWINKKRPFMTAKIAISMDGKIGVQNKQLQITGPVIQKTTMRLRAQANAILVGVNTILCDDPWLTVRNYPGRHQPIRAILDTHLKTPMNAKILHSEGGSVWIFCGLEASQTKQAGILQQNKATIIPVATDASGRCQIEKVIEYFSAKEMISILVEGGTQVISSFSLKNLIDQWVFYLSPIMIGEIYQDRASLGLHFSHPFHLRFQSVIRRGHDLEIWAA